MMDDSTETRLRQLNEMNKVLKCSFTFFMFDI
jgi:hypothetical protein